MSKKKQQSKRLAGVTRKLIYLTGNPFRAGIGIYAQAIDIAMKIVGVSEYSGHPRKFIQDNLEALEAYAATRAGDVARLKKDDGIARTRGSKFGAAKKAIKPSLDVASAAFLETYEWRKLRMQALKKYGPKCMCCGATPATGAVMNVDHIKPRKLFPALAMDLDNLQVLCHECNHGKGNWDQTDWRAKV